MTASFSDTDGNYSDSSGSDGPVTPSAAASSTVVADNAATTSTGGTLVFTATVSGPGGTPAGTVAWTGSACSSTTDLSAGVATCSITDAQASSSYSVTASFSDTDGNYSDSSGSDGPVTPAAAASSTVVADNAATTSTGGTLVFTATVSGPGGTPAGTVAWTGSACSSTTDLTAGVATCSITDAQASSSYSVTASFSDTDGNYSDSSGSDGPVTPAAAASSTVVADNAATTSTGGTLVFTATVSGPGGTPAGTVAWTGSACSSTTDLSAGVATCSITDAQASSSYSVTASFSDTDGNYSDSSGSDGPVTPAAAASSTVVADNAATTSTGGTLVFTATVSGPGGTPAGTVAWTGSACSSTTDLTAGVATCSITDAQASSSYSVTASFSDTDGNYSDSSGSDGPVTPSAAASSTVVADNAATTSTGGTLVFTATVSGPGGTPAGTVAWTGSACSSTTDLSAGVATCSITDAQASSSYSVTASFSDTDGNYSDSSGSDGPVTPAAAASSTVVADNAATTSTGGTLVFTATVSGPGGTPAGTVAWTGSACSSTTDLSAGVATCSITDAQASSSYSVTASFSDTDGNYSDSSGSDGPVTPAAAASSTVVADNAATTSTGGTLVFTATVSGPGGTPAGTVAWTGSACSSTTDLSAGVATCSITDAQASSSYSVTASFSDTDGNYSDSSGSDGPVTPSAAASSTVVADNAATTSTGGTLVFTATVSGPGGTPAGTVAWTGSACSSTTDLSAGVATCSITDAQASSSYSVTASFSDTDGNYSDSSGSDGPVTPSAAASSTVVADNAATTSTGGTLVFTATVSGPGGTPAGTVAWTGSACSSTTDLSAGVATCSITDAQASSSYSVTASFSDTDGNYSDSSGSDGPVTPSAAASSTVVADNAATTSTGGTLVFTATVSGPGGTPAGTVAWTGSACSSTTDLSAGVATCSITDAQASSSYSVTASFSDTDGNYSDSSGSDGPVTPAAAASSTVVADNAATTSTGGTLVFTATVSGPGGTPAGTVAWTGSACSSTTDLSAGVATCSITDAQASSSYSVTASFSDTDGNYSDSSGSDGPVTPSAAASSTVVADNAATTSTGGTLVFTATVSAPAARPPAPLRGPARRAARPPT